MSTTVQQLSDAWNALRSAAVGRGFNPPAGVSSELSDEVEHAWAEWRTWLEDQGPLAEVQREITLIGDGREWADRYEALAEQVTRATGKRLPLAPSSPIEQAASQIGSKLSPWALLVFAGAGAVIAAKLLGGIRMRAR